MSTWDDFFSALESRAVPQLRKALADIGWELNNFSGGNHWEARRKKPVLAAHLPFPPSRALVVAGRLNSARSVSADGLAARVQAINAIKLDDPNTWPEDFP